MPNSTPELTAQRLRTLESAMRRAIEIARQGPTPDTNPRVGCVILGPDGRIVAEGWHLGAGTAHAETDALAHLSQEWRDRAQELTAVVTLEPCNHVGNTGPCAEALIRSGIGTVVYAFDDPGIDSGGGATRLADAGITVISGVLEAEARVLVADWLAQRNPQNLPMHSRPYVVAKWAQTLDGRAAADNGTSQWITGPEARAHVHAERAQADAILVGTGTLLADNPSLTARTSDGSLLVPAEQQPLPIVFGKRNTPRGAAILEHPALAARGLTEPIRLTGTDLAGEIAGLVDRGVNRLYIEGGPTVVSTLMRAGLVDELHVYIAPKLLGGTQVAIRDLGISDISEALNLVVTGTTKLGNDLLVTATLKPTERST